jgi:hypothetical protein
VVVDLYRLESDSAHRYDYPIHFRGQLIATSVKYDADVARLEPLGAAHGYQHVWREAVGRSDSLLSVTWLDGNRYYSWLGAAARGTRVTFGRTGANDPNFNLVSEPLFLVRREVTGGSTLFAAAIEPHGYFSEAQERSQQARPRLQGVRVVAETAEGSVVEVSGPDGLRWVLMTTNRPASAAAAHRITAGGATYEWTGNWAVRGVEAVR